MIGQRWAAAAGRPVRSLAILVTVFWVALHLAVPHHTPAVGGPHTSVTHAVVAGAVEQGSPPATDHGGHHENEGADHAADRVRTDSAQELLPAPPAAVRVPPVPQAATVPLPGSRALPPACPASRDLLHRLCVART